LLTYNIVTEAHKRRFMMDSIISRRIDITDRLQRTIWILEWGNFLPNQADRIVRWAFPVWDYDGIRWLNVIIVLGMVAAIVAYGVRVDVVDRKTLALMVLAGMVWLIAMRNLSAFHDYTTMYYLSFTLAFYVSALSLLRISQVRYLCWSAGHLAFRNQEPGFIIKSEALQPCMRCYRIMNNSQWAVCIPSDKQNRIHIPP
jgi:hypothetical protein